MSKLFKRMSQHKVQMQINLKFMEIRTKNPIKEEFYITWKRGQLVEMTKNYTFVQSNRSTILTRLDLVDKEFEKVSAFYTNKEGIFQKKMCEFAIMVGKNTEARMTFDMSKQVGNKNKPIEIHLAGNYIIKVLFKIIPYANV